MGMMDIIPDIPEKFTHPERGNKEGVLKWHYGGFFRSGYDLYIDGRFDNTI